MTVQLRGFSPARPYNFSDELDSAVLEILVKKRRERGSLFVSLSSKFLARKLNLPRGDASDRKVWLSLRRLQRQGLAIANQAKPTRKWGPSAAAVKFYNGGVQG